jgi:hypothetical protein
VAATAAKPMPFLRTFMWFPFPMVGGRSGPLGIAKLQ